MADTIYVIENRAKSRAAFGWAYKLFLFLTFIWANIYAAACMISENQYAYYGFFRAFSDNFVESTAIYAISLGIIYWILFEILLFVYKSVLGFSIYGYVVPFDALKNEARLFYAIRNIIYGAVAFLCFKFAYLYSVLELLNLCFVVILLILFALRLQKKYSSPLVSQFVFKTLVIPVFFYEIIMLIISIWGIL